MTILLHLIQVMELSPARGQMVARPPVEVCMGQAVRFQEILRRLAMIDEVFVEDEAGLGLGQVMTCTLDPKTVALLRVGASVATGSSAVCLEWSAGRALAAGASEDEIADVLLAVLPVTGLGRVVSATPDLATALGYDVGAALEN
jgi:alkylhydroperoxidase/carboxymuconolactone decarboxylase family protein YurZ